MTYGQIQALTNNSIAINGRGHAKKLRCSSYIQHSEAQQFLTALVLFEQSGKPVNTLVTVNLDTEWLNIPSEECSVFTRQSFQRLRVRLLSRSNRWAVAWVLENVETVGVHLHFLIHRSKPFVKDHYGFGKLLRSAFLIEKPRAKTIKFCKFRTWRISHEENRGNLQRYLLKGIRPELADQFGIRARKQGQIIGKRTGAMGIR